jgi:glycosyltransferase involved in cell wall biosynthesis
MEGSNPNRPLKIALACPGVGLSQRGFERMFHDLFRLVEGELDVTLFKGGGPASDREKVPFFLPRNGRFVRYFPVHALVGRTPIHVECMTFALALLPHLREGRYDVVHCIDPPLTRILYKLRRMLGMQFRLLYTHGVTMPPSDYPPADHLQHVAEGPFHECVEAGISPGSMTLLPCGFYPERFDTSRSREELRREYGVAPGTFVILSVAALNRSHKRSHHLIDEAAKLEGDFLLWLDASMDQGEPDLVDYAKSRLGERCRITHVPSAKVGELYRMADVLAHASVFESFGLSIVEASSSGLPVLIHDAPHFRWLVPNPQAWLDMTVPGALAGRLSFLMAHPEALGEIRRPDGVRRRFSWHFLRQDYKALYERVAEMPLARQGGANPNYYWQLHG